MDRRSFMKYLGGTGLAMVGGEALGAISKADTDGIFQSTKQAWSKGSVRFRSTGKLKIVQFTDIHYKMHQLEDSHQSVLLMDHVLKEEKPDLVIYTGDLTDSKGAIKAVDDILSVPAKYNIPFAVVFGNHDDSFEYSRQQLYDHIQKKKGALMPVRVCDESPDYVIPVKSSNSDEVKSLLYLIDSHAYTVIDEIGGYDWIHDNQIAWYRQVGMKYAEMNAGKPLPSLAFFHIPIPEFREALRDDSNRFFGVKAEGIACPKLNSGFFTAVRERGDVMGIFVGHDHNNDYAVMYKDVLLAYGRYSGGNTAYNDIANGCRIIELQQDERKFESYIRLGNDEIESKITYPETFVVKNYNKINNK